MEACRAAEGEDMTEVVLALAWAGQGCCRCGTGLHEASSACREPVVVCLLMAGGPALLARRLLTTAGGGTCLHSAAGQGNLLVAEALCAAAAAGLPAFAWAGLLEALDGGWRTTWDVALNASCSAHDPIPERFACSSGYSAASLLTVILGLLPIIQT